MKRKTVIYLVGASTNVEQPFESFEAMEEKLNGLGYVVLSPVRLPKGLTALQRILICSEMIEQADAVVEMHGWSLCPAACYDYGYAMEHFDSKLIFKDIDALAKKVPTWQEVEL